MSGTAIAHSQRVVVVGTGLAGLTTTHQLLSRGISVTLIEKTGVVGMASNSNKASSGINGVLTKQQVALGIEDSVELFVQDTVKSARSSARPDLIDVLTSRSRGLIEWLTQQFDIDLSKVSQLGGHSLPRTHRGSGALPPGYAIVSTLLKLLNKYVESSQLQILKNSQVIKLLSDNDKVYGLQYKDVNSNIISEILSNNIVLLTGGFSADFNENSLITKYRPELILMPSTNGKQTTGDGIKLLTAINAATVDMDKIQIHPTGFIDPQDPQSKWKFLAGEVLRGVGGVLLDSTGHRFVNELSTRDVVTELIYRSHSDDDQVWLVIPESCYNDLKTHIDFYMSKNLIKKGELAELAELMSVDLGDLTSEFNTYNSLRLSRDTFQRSSFGPEFGNSVFYGKVTPVLHFCMGGLKIDSSTRVQSTRGTTIKGLYAVGEVSGGVHGYNRLGGSSLLECVVFGTVASEEICGNSS